MCPRCAQSGPCVGDLGGTFPTQMRRGDVAVCRPHCRAHVPTVGVSRVTRGFEILGEKRRILVGGFRLAGLDSGGQTPVHLGDLPAGRR
jgi:hypothetical protein